MKKQQFLITFIVCLEKNHSLSLACQPWCGLFVVFRNHFLHSLSPTHRPCFLTHILIHFPHSIIFSLLYYTNYSFCSPSKQFISSITFTFMWFLFYLTQCSSLILYTADGILCITIINHCHQFSYLYKNKSFPI